MFCTYCGAQLQVDQRFCRSCGNLVTPGPPLPPAGAYMARHVRLLGIFWIALSAIHLVHGGGRLLGARVAWLIGHTWFDDVSWGWPLSDFLHSLLSLVGALTLLLAIAGFVVGFGLLEHRRWARTLTIIMGIIALFNPPLGTALGIYTLWVLLPAHAEEEYRRMARPV